MKTTDDLYLELLDKINDNEYTNEEKDLINKAYTYATKVHQGMVRKNGDAYIAHPLNVAIIVANLNSDAITVIAALLHETITHGDATLEDLEENFGVQVRGIIESLMKINKLHLTDDSESSAINLRKILVALSEDVRVIIIKLASRLHNLRTREGLEPDLQVLKAKETKNVLIPIAHRLGINQLKSELEDLTFRILNPELYDQIESELPVPRKELEEMLHEAMDEISDLLRDNNISFDIKCRVKSVNSIDNKFRSGHTWKNIYDILGIRIICEEIPDCYLIIGLIHSKFKPIPKRFKDYIAMPKNNSYQSLHTGIYGPENLPLEVQVRTKEMNEIAEHGIASHWSYKEHGTKAAQSIMEQKLSLFRTMIEENADEEEVKNTIDTELLSDSIYINTPKGDVVELPKDSTPIDFAYRIHSKVGDTTVGAIVNGEIVTLDYKLQDGDEVKIMTDQNSTPKLDWLNIATTTQAKSKIKSYFSKQDRENYITRGKDLLEKELRKRNIAIKEALSEDNINKLIDDLRVSDYEEILLNIGSLRYTPVYIVDLIYNNKENVEDAFLDKISRQVTTKTNYANDIIVSGMDDLLVNLASCCRPIYGDEIIGYITKGRGITVHKKECANIQDLNERLIDVKWNDRNENDKKYISHIKVFTNETKTSLMDIVAKATSRNIQMTSINEKSINDRIVYDLLIRVSSKEDLDLFINDLEMLKFVDSVKRF